MVSQPGVGPDAGRVLKMLVGITFDRDDKPVAGRNPLAPFKTEIQAYRFCAMVGLAFGKKSNIQIQTKWSANSQDLVGPEFDKLISIVGDDLEREDWVDTMNQSADWGAKYIHSYYYSAGNFNISPLVELLHSGEEISECRRCGVFGSIQQESCWTGCGESFG